MLLNAGVSRYFEDNFKTSFPCYFFAKTFCLDYFRRFSKKVIGTSINHYRGGKISTQSSILCTFSINPKFFSSVHCIRLYVVMFQFFSSLSSVFLYCQSGQGALLEIVRILSLKLQLNFLDILWLGIIGLATALLET